MAAKKVSRKERYAGAMLGFAIGDAIGYNVKMLSFEEIKQKYGKKGFIKPESFKISDETQLMILTAHGLIWADNIMKSRDDVDYEDFVFLCYQMWLYTQTGETASDEYDWIFDNEENDFICPLLADTSFCKKRGPTRSIVQTLSGITGMEYGKPNNKINSSKLFDCVPRCLPCGLIFRNDPDASFEYGSKVAAITHGAPQGFLTGGAFSAIIAYIMQGKTIEEAAALTIELLEEYKSGAECADALRMALELVEGDTAPMEAISQLGDGSEASSALAIGLYCASAHYEYENAVLLAANQDGNSDACAAIAGAIRGAYIGYKSIPSKWVDSVQFSKELKDYTTLLLKASKK